jgi:hypothetical protein
MPANSFPIAKHANESAADFLFSPKIMAEITDREARGIYTLERCPPEIREATIKLVALGQSHGEICEMLRVHPSTVHEIANRYAVEIADYERVMPAKSRRCKFKLLDRLERGIESMRLQDVPFALKQVHDLEAADSGRVTARVEHTIHVDLFGDDWTATKRALGFELDPIEAKNDGAGAPGMSLPGRNNLLMAAAPADPGAELQPAADPGPEPGIDAQSDVFSSISQEDPDNLTGYLTGLIPESPANREPQPADPESNPDPGHPRGGDAGGPWPPAVPTDKSSQKFSANGDVL